MSRSIPILLSLLAGAAACGGWHRVDDLTPRSLPPRDQVQVWRDRQVTLLQGVELASDSLGGVPFTQPPTCDSCRVYLALSEVDSLRVGNKERAFFRTAGLVAAVGMVWAYLFRGVGGD